MDNKKLATVTKLYPGDALASLLQDKLYEVLTSEQFDSLSICQTVGVLEFLKWNLINGC